jgi:glucose-1-phosphate thymidylyltransferase
MRVVGIVPAAGVARRLQPLPCSKELLLVEGRPVIEYLLTRLERAGCEEIRVVTRPDKADLRGYLSGRDVEVMLAETGSAAESLALGTAGLGDRDTVLFGFPDTIWHPEDGLADVREALRPPYRVALGIFHGEEPARSDVVEVDDDRVTRVHVKPRVPPGDQVWGCAALEAGTLRTVADEAGVLFDALARRGLVAAVELPGSFVDVGTPQAMRRLGASAA